MSKGIKEDKRKLQLMVSNEFYEWFKEEAEKRGLQDRMGRFLEIFIKELQDDKSAKEKEGKEMS